LREVEAVHAAPDSLAPTISPGEEAPSPAPPAAESEEPAPSVRSKAASKDESPSTRAKAASISEDEPASKRPSSRHKTHHEDDETDKAFFAGADAVVEKMKAEARKAAHAAEAIEAPVVVVVTAQQLARRAQFRRVVMGVVALAGLLALGMIVQIATAPKQSALSMLETPPMPKGPPIPTAVVIAEAPPRAVAVEANSENSADPAASGAPDPAASGAPASASASAAAAGSAAPSASVAAAASAAPEASAAGAAGAAGAASAAPEGSAPRDPEQAKALTKSALAMLERGNNKGAIEKAEASVAADPTDAAAYLYWGTALMEIGKQGEAKKVFARCVAEATRGPKNDCRQFR
jgi:hypothetical protein